jgi:hypothetical protein
VTPQAQPSCRRVRYVKSAPYQVLLLCFSPSLLIRPLRGVRLGLNGYALQQLTADKVDGRSQAKSEERVFGIGPGIMLSGNGVSLYLNSYFETGAENRPEGTKVVFRLSKVFRNLTP